MHRIIIALLCAFPAAANTITYDISPVSYCTASGCTTQAGGSSPSYSEPDGSWLLLSAGGDDTTNTAALNVSAFAHLVNGNFGGSIRATATYDFWATVFADNGYSGAGSGYIVNGELDACDALFCQESLSAPHPSFTFGVPFKETLTLGVGMSFFSATPWAGIYFRPEVAAYDASGVHGVSAWILFDPVVPPQADLPPASATPEPGFFIAIAMAIAVAICYRTRTRSTSLCQVLPDPVYVRTIV